MTSPEFEERLRCAFDTLAHRLRDDTARQLQVAADELLADFRSGQDSAVKDARAALAAALDEIAELKQAVTSRTDPLNTTLNSASNATTSSSTRANSAAAPVRDRLLQAVRSIDRGRSLSEILNLVVDAAAREAARVAVLMVRDDELHGWRGIGFGAALDQPGGIRCPVGQSGVIAEAVRSGERAIAVTRSAAPPFAGNSGDRAMCALPMRVGGRVVAVLYADQGDDTTENNQSPAALEVITRHAANALELLAVRRAMQAMGGVPTALLSS